MRIAVIVSGRIAMYEVGLSSILESSKHDIDLFVSLNGENCEYYDKMKERLKNWLKFCNIEVYKLDEAFCKSLKTSYWPNTVHCKIVDDFFVPYNVMSMYYNEKKAFNAAVKYSQENNFEYDCFMKLRSDIVNVKIDEIKEYTREGLYLYSALPGISFISKGIHNRQIVSDCWAWGNKETMSIYFNTYDYVIQKTKEMDGKYFISFECSLLDNLVDNNVEYEITQHTLEYILYHKNRSDKENSRENYGELNFSRGTSR